MKLKDRESGNVITRFIARPNSNFNNAKAQIKKIANSLKVNNNKAKKEAEEAEAKREEQRKKNEKAKLNAKKAENNAKKAEEVKREEKMKKRQARLNNIRNREIAEEANNKLKALEVRINKFVPRGWLGGRRKEFLARAKQYGVMTVHNDLNKRLKLKKQVDKSEHANKLKLLNSIHDPKFNIDTLKNKITENSNIVKMYKNSVKKVESMKDLSPVYKSTFINQLKGAMKMPSPKMSMNLILENANRKRNPNKPPPPPPKENKKVMNRERKRVQAKLINAMRNNKPPSQQQNNKANLKKKINNTLKGRASKNASKLKRNVNAGKNKKDILKRLNQLNKRTQYQKK